MESVECFLPKVRAIIRGLLWSHSADWEDIVQSVMLHVVRAIPNFHGECEPLTWIYRITTNECYDYLRCLRSHRSVICMSDLSESDALKAECQPAREPAADVRASRRETLTRLMSTLDPQSRALLVARADGAKIGELSVRFGLTVTTVKQRLYRTRRKLQESYRRAA